MEQVHVQRFVAELECMYEHLGAAAGGATKGGEGGAAVAAVDALKAFLVQMRRFLDALLREAFLVQMSDLLRDHPKLQSFMASISRSFRNIAFRWQWRGCSTSAGLQCSWPCCISASATFSRASRRAAYDGRAA